jgi:hypothetical protein
MTLPFERTLAVLKTQEFLLDLAFSPANMDPELLRARARTLLRHFPEDVDLILSAALVPRIWGKPDARRYE